MGKKADGCAYGMVNREMINNLKSDLTEIKKSTGEIVESNNKMFNHFSERYEKMFDKVKNRISLPMTFVITFLTSLCVGLIVSAVR